MDKPIEEAIYEQGFYLSDNFLDREDYHILRSTIEILQQDKQFKRAKIGKQEEAVYNNTIRNDLIHWLNNDTSNSAIKSFLAKIAALKDRLNQALYLGLHDFEAHFAIYQPGNFYKKHVDQFASKKERRISCVYYLNAAWQESFAGQLKLYDLNDQLLVQVLPLGNRFICFNSELPHEVCETKHIRYSIAGWMKTRPWSP